MAECDIDGGDPGGIIAGTFPPPAGLRMPDPGRHGRAPGAARTAGLAMVEIDKLRTLLAAAERDRDRLRTLLATAVECLDDYAAMKHQERNQKGADRADALVRDIRAASPQGVPS